MGLSHAQAGGTRLPVRLTSFVGREEQLQEVGLLLQRHRLVSLIGAGGCGKTRFAVRLGESVSQEYPDGLFFVELGALVDRTLVPHTIAAVLGVREEAGRSLVDSLLARLGTMNLLLVLDNCEHLIDDCAALATAILQGTESVRLLVTSREVLGVDGEVRWRVPSLTIPESGRASAAEALLQYEAVRLFAERTAMVDPGFSVTAENAPAVAELCRRLDGIPLALELAAARIGVLSVSQILERLNDQFNLLSGGGRTVVRRHQTMAATLDWSYDLLTESEQLFWRRASIFAGGFDLKAAEAVCPGDGLVESEVLDLVARLADTSILHAEDAGAAKRYRLLETTRQYGHAKLAAADEEAAVATRHAVYYVGVGAEAEPHLAGPAQTEWMRRLERDFDNCRSALDWSLRCGPAEAGLQLALALNTFVLGRGYWREGRNYLDSLLTQVGEESPNRPRGLSAMGVLSAYLGEHVAAHQAFEEATRLYRAREDRRGIATVQHNQASALLLKGDYSGARPRFEECLALWRELGDKVWAAKSVLNLGIVARAQGDHKAARACYEESLLLSEELRDRRGVALALQNLAVVHTHLAEFDLATEYSGRSLAHWRELGDKRGVAAALLHRGVLCAARGDLTEARVLTEEGLTLAGELGDQRVEAMALINLWDIAVRERDLMRAKDLALKVTEAWSQSTDGEHMALCFELWAGLFVIQPNMEAAAVCFGAAEAIRERSGTPAPTMLRDQHDRDLAAVRAGLDENALAARWEQGRSSAISDAIRFVRAAAFRIVPPSPNEDPAARGAGTPHGMTAREREIVELIAEGMSDREIAARLHISPRTVDTHLRAIFRKVGVSSRAGLAAWAVRMGLVVTEP